MSEFMYNDIIIIPWEFQFINTGTKSFYHVFRGSASRPDHKPFPRLCREKYGNRGFVHAAPLNPADHTIMISRLSVQRPLFSTFFRALPLCRVSFFDVLFFHVLRFDIIF